MIDVSYKKASHFCKALFKKGITIKVYLSGMSK